MIPVNVHSCEFFPDFLLSLIFFGVFAVYPEEFLPTYQTINQDAALSRPRLVSLNTCCFLVLYLIPGEVQTFEPSSVSVYSRAAVKITSRATSHLHFLP